MMEDLTSVNNNVHTPDASCPPSYDDLFPALPEHSYAAPTTNNVPPKSMRVGSSVVAQVFHVPCDERKSSDSDKFGEGESSLRICQQIMKETGTHIEISSCKDQSLTFIVRGKQNEVLDARRKILVHFQTQANKQINIPKEHHGMILGKKAERLKELEKITATKISIPNINDESDVITISGTKEDIERAEFEIRTMSDEQSKKASERISVPKIYHPFIMGPYGTTLAQLSSDTGAKINIPPQNVMKDEIFITGEKEKVLMAKARIEEIYKEMEKKCAMVSVEVAKSQHRYIIGQKKSTIQEILQLTGVSVEMPPPDSLTDTITLRGPQAALGNALTVVYEKANSVKSTEIEAPTWIHKYIIGKRGAYIKEIEQEYPNVGIFTSEGKIKVEGSPEMVDKAHAHLEGLVNHYQANYTFIVMSVNTAFCKHIIGKSGANINRLKDELQVTVNIDDKEGENIRIEGPKEGVHQAQLELQAQIDKLENEKVKDVVIDRRLYRSIIGAKGEKIREIKDRYKLVQIHIPGPNENIDIVKLRGPKDDVDKCHKDLMKLVKDIQELNYKVEVPIFKQFHRFVIGKGGANIKKIRDETQTKIDLPAEGDRNEVIVITGKRENVLDAKERIQNIQGELSEIVTEDVRIPVIDTNTQGSISRLMDECGGITCKFDPNSDMATLRGPKEDVEKVRIILRELSGDQPLTSIEFRAKKHHHKFLIGKNGSSMKKVCETHSVKLFFPKNDEEDKENIVILGSEMNVQGAKEMLENIIVEQDQVVDDEVIVDPKHHKHFVSKRGEVLNRITDECGGVMISFPRSGVDSDRVTLKGMKDFIDLAKQRILEIVADLEAQVTIECVIPQKYHRKLLTSRGMKIEAIKSDFDVQIKIPGKAAEENTEEMVNGGDDEVKQCDIIKITGRIENCEAAKKALFDLVPVTEDINVPFDYHRLIIGQKGAKVRELMTRYDVHIELSPAELKTDIIKITGTSANVIEAKDAIFKCVEEHEAERKNRELRSFEMKFEVDPQYYSKIIGPKGSNVKKLRSDFNVNISFPRREETDHFIVVQGYENDAIAARDEILKIVNSLDEQTREIVDIDHRVHARLIGQRGRNIKKIIDDFKVEIKLAKKGDSNPNAVTIIGEEAAVQEAKDHILNLAEEYLQMVEESTPPPTANNLSNVFEDVFNKRGFVVHGAPWERKSDDGASGDNSSAPNTMSYDDFPGFGLPNNINDDSNPVTSAWGPRR